MPSIRHSRIIWRTIAILQACVIIYLARQSSGPVVNIVERHDKGPKNTQRNEYTQTHGENVYDVNKRRLVEVPDLVAHQLHNDDLGNLKPLLVFGILSGAEHYERRAVLRKTWLATAQSVDFPFRFTYKFLLDLPTNDSIEEDKVHHDIVYLNMTHHGYAVKLGEKLYRWIMYIVSHFPDALMGARVDDDVFLCVPQIFQRLDQVKSSRLYYGWTPNSGRNSPVDEMFIVFGRELMERIAIRPYCKQAVGCDKTKYLENLDLGGRAIHSWISIYDDVEFVRDNGRIIHYYRGRQNEFENYVKPHFCERWILFHKSTAEQMQLLFEYNTASINRKRAALSKVGSEQEIAVSGSLFTGNIGRSLPQRKISLATVANITLPSNTKFQCDNWAVVTTIFPPSAAINDIAKNPNWCLVIVGDSKTPADQYKKKIKESEKSIFLSINDQYKLYPDLADSIPLNNFGRKNIGYIYAMHHAAKMIWDFDDDNRGIIDLKQINSSGFVTICNGFKQKVANPNPYFNSYIGRLWPRGFPLQYIRQPEFIPQTCEHNDRVNLGVVQSLANVEPDVDAVYRLAYGTPFNFTAKKGTSSSLVLPSKVYSPFNAQATLWFPNTFKYMALPISINGRVSDIWRSYIAQYFMQKDGTNLAFSPPYVTQRRNAHDHMQDFNAELDLYQKSKQLLDYLTSKDSGMVHNLTTMYEELYRRGYLERDDLDFINAWDRTVQSIMQHQ